jgi:hypothetical protein
MENACYRCGCEPYLSKNYEEIDGAMRLLCGKCINYTCSICGKTRYGDDVTRWSHTVDPETGKLLNFGSCCIFIEGKQDAVKQGIRKYNDLQHKDPDTFNKLNEQIEHQKMARQQVLNQQPVADKLIDGWAANKKKNKILT